MAQAAEDNTPREWILDDYYRLVRLTLGCGINAALREMDRRVVMREAQLIEYGDDDKANPVDPLDFLRNYTFQVVDRDERVRVVTRRPAAGFSITSVIKFDPSDPDGPPVQMGPGRVMDGFYTIVEQPPRTDQQPEDKVGPDQSKIGAAPKPGSTHVGHRRG